MNILRELLKRPIAFQPVVAKAFGSIKLGVLWSQFYYWHDKTTNKDGWFYKTQAEIYEETALSRREQENARAKGKELGVIEERLAGNPAKMHYKLDLDKSFEIITKFLQKIPEEQKTRQIKQTASIDYLKNIPSEDIKELSEKYRVGINFIKEKADDVITYCESKGKFYRDYKSALANFIKSDIRKNPEIKVITTPKETVEKLKELDKPRTREEQNIINDQIRKVRETLGGKFQK